MKTSYFALVLGSLLLVGCRPSRPVESASGVGKATVKITTGSDGLTAEQRNIRDRLVEDNKSGSIKHLYVISAYSGDVLIYSTVRGKVTSGGKRLTPTAVSFVTEGNGGSSGFHLEFGGLSVYTNEVLQDDGTYGSSSDYLFWWDTRGVYHQHYVQGGQIVHISNQPLVVKKVIINMELIPSEQPTTPP